MNTFSFIRLLNHQFWIAIGLSIAGGIYGLSRQIIAIILLTEVILMYCTYRCPTCKKNFDIRIKLSELRYCPNCGMKLEEDKCQ